jgi:hypothetical protein
VNDQQPCTREDLRAIVLIESSWGVNENGTIDITDHYGEGGGDTEYIDYYRCDNCDMTFESEDGSTWLSWEAALDHLTPKEVV